MNSLVLQLHQQNIQICTQNLRLKHILSSIVITVPLHIPVFPVIPSLKKLFLHLQHLIKHFHIHMHTFMGPYEFKTNQRKKQFH